MHKYYILYKIILNVLEYRRNKRLKMSWNTSLHALATVRTVHTTLHEFVQFLAWEMNLQFQTLCAHEFPYFSRHCHELRLQYWRAIGAISNVSFAICCKLPPVTTRATLLQWCCRRGGGGRWQRCSLTLLLLDMQFHSSHHPSRH